MQAQASAADVDLIDRMLINRRLRRIRTKLRPHSKLESVHHLQSNVPDDFDELDIMRPRPSPRHCAKAKLESPLEEDLHGPSIKNESIQHRTYDIRLEARRVPKLGYYS